MKKRAFYKLSLSTLVAVYILILVGGIVRSTGSGMGCPDWPHCFGNWVPPTSVSQLPEDYKEFYSNYRQKKNEKFARYLNLIGLEETASKILSDKSVLEEADFNPTKTWIEYINRLTGVVIGFLILAVALYSLKFRKENRKIVAVSLLTFILVCFQGWIGSVVVSTNLTPWTITIHMFLALIIVALLIYLVIRSSDSPGQKFTGVNKALLVACMVVLLTQILGGTQVREAIDRIAAVAARAEWISRVTPEFLMHRSFSWVVLLLHIALIVNLRKTTPVKALPIALILLILATMITGAGMSYWAVPPFLQPLHLVLATVCFGLQFALLVSKKEEEKITTEVLI